MLGDKSDEGLQAHVRAMAREFALGAQTEKQFALLGKLNLYLLLLNNRLAKESTPEVR